MKHLLLASMTLFVIIIDSSTVEGQNNIHQWKITDLTNNEIRTHTNYGLKNLEINSLLEYYHRSIGISLAFDRNQSPTNIKFLKEGGRPESIKYEEKFAIYVEGGGYLYYSSKPFGINLDYSSNPQFEWKFRDKSFGPQQLKTVHSRDSLSIYNTSNNGYLVFGRRDVGPDLNWSNRPLQSPQIPDPVPSVGQIALSLKSGPYTVPSITGKCAGRITWTLVPIQLTGNDGTDETIEVDRYYESIEVSTEKLKWWCFYNEVIPGLKEGKWKLIVKIAGWTTDCIVEIKSGNNQIVFELNKPGCNVATHYQEGKFNF